MAGEGYGRREEIMHLREQGLTIQAISIRMNLARSTVWLYLQGKYKSGNESRRKYDHDRLRSLFISLGSVAAVAYEVGCSYDTVKNAVQDLLDDAAIDDRPPEEYKPEFEPWDGGDIWVADRQISCTRRYQSRLEPQSEREPVRRLTKLEAINRYLDGDRGALSRWLERRAR